MTNNRQLQLWVVAIWAYAFLALALGGSLTALVFGVGAAILNDGEGE